MYGCIYVCMCICMCMCIYIYVYVCVYIYISFYISIGRPPRRSTCVPVIIGSASFEVWVMEQAARQSSNCSPASGRITRVRASTMASVLSWSSGGWTVWMRMRWVSRLRSGSRLRMLTPRRCLWQWFSTQANWEPLVSHSGKCFPPETAARRRSTCGAGIRQLEGTGPKRFIMSVDDDTEFRSRCEWIYICVLGEISLKTMCKNVIKSPEIIKSPEK